jgi:Spy/CpxP family protein refolding chaperone
MKTATAILAAAALAAGTAVMAQQPPPPGPAAPGGAMGPRGAGLMRPGDPISENLAPPELIMQHQKALGLKEEQQLAIRTDMQKTMARFTDLQWQQSAEAEALAALLKQERPDEKQVLDQLDKLMAIENEIKRLHLGAMIRVNLALTAEQREKLRDLRPAPRGPTGMGPGGPGAIGPGLVGPRPGGPPREQPSVPRPPPEP